MAKTKTPPVTIDTRDYEKFQLLAENEDLSTSALIRELIKAFIQVKLHTGKDLTLLAQEYVLNQAQAKDRINKYMFSTAPQSLPQTHDNS